MPPSLKQLYKKIVFISLLSLIQLYFLANQQKKNIINTIQAPTLTPVLQGKIIQGFKNCRKLAPRETRYNFIRSDRSVRLITTHYNKAKDSPKIQSLLDCLNKVTLTQIKERLASLYKKYSYLIYLEHFFNEVYKFHGHTDADLDLIWQENIQINSFINMSQIPDIFQKTFVSLIPFYRGVLTISSPRKITSITSRSPLITKKQIILSILGSICFSLTLLMLVIPIWPKKN